MKRNCHRPAFVLTAAALAACQPSGHAPEAATSQAYSGIGTAETVHFTGTEPFWGGEVSGTRLRYSTPENIEGTTLSVERFAGNNGVSFSGRLEGRAFDLMVTPGACSDGMSDRTYPFHATLKLGEETRRGCAWTDSKPYSGPRHP